MTRSAHIIVIPANSTVIPANAGIQFFLRTEELGPGLRRDDEVMS